MTPTLGRLPWCCVCILDILLFYLHTLTHGHAPASQVTHSHPPASHSYEFGGGGLFLDPRDSALGFMSLRAPGRDPPRPLIPEARPEAGGLLRVQGQPVLAGREPGLPGRLRRHGDREGHRAAPARGSWRRPAAWGEGSRRGRARAAEAESDRGETAGSRGRPRSCEHMAVPGASAEGRELRLRRGRGREGGHERRAAAAANREAGARVTSPRRAPVTPPLAGAALCPSLSPWRRRQPGSPGSRPASTG